MQIRKTGPAGQNEHMTTPNKAFEFRTSNRKQLAGLQTVETSSFERLDLLC